MAERTVVMDAQAVSRAVFFFKQKTAYEMAT